MRVLVDLLGYTGGRGGTETYVRELLPRLHEHLPGVELIALTGRAGIVGVTAFFPGPVETIRWVGGGRATWAAGEIVAVNRTARRVGADLIWSPANFGPLTRGGAGRIVSVHDVIYHEVRGSGLAGLARSVTAWLMTRTARSADRLLTVSDAAASAIARHLGVPPARISVVHNGSAEPRTVENPWESLEPLGIDASRPLLLSAGNRMPHKNFVGLLDALAALSPDQRPRSVIVGGGPDDPLTPAVAARGLDADVVLPGWVSDDQLASLYSAAGVYACPSLVEGFGLPVVDALRAECIVVANDVPVLHEVGGEYAFYADATNPTAFAAAISRAFDLDRAAGDRRRSEGRAWAERFNWDAAAEAVAAVLRSELHTARTHE
ncbi:glycosyltransferase family 1 protein [Microbacterium sp. SGAir0570]|uniref:glycosyltransferase family 4 protein n=1 Tax=unclassified Microbacterium TaxID=2609290 RepID=UPI000CDDF7F2|nr:MULTISPECIES: glycosyltransferase family 1 protein [unclassified Microbacterium]POX65839.1 hypothetical protein C3481_14920 [Microbacterium sp. Ru50]QCR41079.1 glycosyltransferase family 1 protein [Microbacterium sp. SGAir0570]